MSRIWPDVLYKVCRRFVSRFHTNDVDRTVRLPDGRQRSPHPRLQSRNAAVKITELRLA
jgi:hypothetical protein